MRFATESAFVLHARSWRETSLLVEVLCAEHGRVGLVARGTTGTKQHALRAALQPLQQIRLQAEQRGELARLISAEAVDIAPRLQGDAALAGFYLNELTLRLAPRWDPQPELHHALARTRASLESPGIALAWALRRYERDLLDALGFGFDWSSDGDGRAIDPAARYWLDPEHGARRMTSDRGTRERAGAATGSALLALAGDRMPEAADDVASLRRPMRAVLAFHLGAKPLKSWEMAVQLSGLRATQVTGSDTGSASSA